MIKKIKIGYATVTIRQIDRADAAASKIFGRYHSDSRTIWIESSQGEDRYRNTLLHEIIHACWDVYGISSDDGEERIVFTLSNALTAALKDNPKLRELI